MTEDAETHAGEERDLPAPSKPKARERGRMRRRLRAQSRIREALLLDLGATVWELHRHGRREPELLQAKASHLAAVDDEVRGLVEALEGGHGIEALVDAGVAGSCAHCAWLLTPGSRYCPACGTAVGMNGALEPEEEEPPPEPEAQTEVVEAPLPGPPGVSGRPAGGPSLRRRVGRRLRGTPPR
ncbi:MAG: zinc ribbon domain-containing protein [Actinomycetota bacterium]